MTRQRLAVYGVLLTSLLLMNAGAALAQITTGGITGSVFDSTHAPVPRVTLHVTNIETQITHESATNEQGEYTFAQLAPGTYSLTAELAGFETLVQRNIEVRVNVITEVNLTLRPGQVRQTVEVVSSPPELQTQSSAVQGVVDHTDINNLPLNGRNFVQLVALEPGVSSIAKTAGGGEDYLSTLFGGAYSVNGVQPDGSSYTFDGIEMRDLVDTRVAFQPTPEAIQEFNFQETNYSAAFGRSIGGIVNITSQGGTNKFHGDVWEYLRNDDLDGRNFFAGVRPSFQQNQFGGASGGPIRQDKTFFFVSYEGFRQIKAITQAATVPTIAERQGNFAGFNPIYNPLATDPVTGLREPFSPTPTVIPTNDISMVSMNALSKLYPLPTSSGTANNLLYPVNQTIDWDQLNVRIDQRISSSDSLAGRWTYLPDVNRLLPFQFTSMPNFSSVWDSPVQNAFIGETHTFGGGAVNEAKIGFTRNKQILQDPQEGTPIDQQIGITGVATATKFLRNPNLSISGLSTTGPISNAPNDRTDNQFAFIDNYTRVKGSWTFSAGVSLVRELINGGSNPSAAGSFTFSGTFTGQLNSALTAVQAGTGNPVADFLLGFPASSARCCVTGDGFRNWRKSDLGTFFQADWKVRPNFTLNMGLRYEIFQAPYEETNRIAEPNISVAPTAALLYAGVSGVPRGFYSTPTDNFSPRIGLAYSPTSKTVLRAGYGLFFLSPQLITQFNMAGQEPFTERDSYTSSAITPQLTLANAFPSGTNIPSASFTAIDPRFRDPYDQGWNASVQRDLGFGTTLTVSYLGSKGSRLQQYNVPVNNPPPGPGSVSARRPIPGYSGISFNDNAGYSDYDALQVRVEKHFSNGLGLLGSYAYSKCIDSGAISDYDGGSAFAIRNPADTTANRGLCNFDIRNRAVFSTVYALPFGKGRTGFLRQVEAGWSAQWILTLEAGEPFSVQMGIDNSNTGTNLDTPNLVGNPNTGPRTPTQWFNLAAFATPAAFTYGSAGRDIVIGPGYTDFDFALHKDFPVNEHQNVEFRVETFNLTNTPNFFQPGRTFGSSSDGVISGAFDPREIQFALKYVF